MKLVVTIAIAAALISCKNESDRQQQENIPDTIEVVDLPPPPHALRVDRKDPDCNEQLVSAIKDIDKGILTYTTYTKTDLKYRVEIRELLKQKNINYVPLDQSCTAGLNCYGYYTDSIISVRFGKDFIATIEKKAKKLSDSRWKNKVYNFQEVDKTAVLINEHGKPIEFADNYAFNVLLLPKGWDSTTKFDNREYVSVSIVIDANGKSAIEPDSFRFNLKKTNEQFTAYLKKDIERVVRQTMHWQPAEMNEHKVKSEEYIDITLN